jgi:hypothetical protein
MLFSGNVYPHKRQYACTPPPYHAPEAPRLFPKQKGKDHGKRGANYHPYDGKREKQGIKIKGKKWFYKRSHYEFCLKSAIGIPLSLTDQSSFSWANIDRRWKNKKSLLCILHQQGL